MDITQLDPKVQDYLIEKLNPFLTDNRKELFNRILNYRTRHMVVVAEDIFQDRNAGAMIRTCDCFGIQDFHLIENKYSKKVTHSIAKGAEKWISRTNHKRDEENTLSCIQDLKAKGYRIIATTPHTNDQELYDFDVTKPAAFFFGSEDPGISQVVEEHADEFLKIPIYGFTESYNVSVATALILQHVTYKLRESDVNWHLNEDEKRELYLEWALKTIKKADIMADSFLKEYEG